MTMGLCRRIIFQNTGRQRSQWSTVTRNTLCSAFGPTISDNNPFEILGIPKASTYHEVKRRFVELALKHHPDLSKDGDSTEFLRIRKAFEMICETKDGNARLSNPSEDGAEGWTEEEFQAWFYNEIGHQDVMFRMDFGTRKEVTEIAKSQSQGGLDRGGMWEMARAMAQQEESLRKKKGDFRGTIGIDSGEAEEPIMSPTGRRRRRK